MTTPWEHTSHCLRYALKTTFTSINFFYRNRAIFCTICTIMLCYIYVNRFADNYPNQLPHPVKGSWLSFLPAHTCITWIPAHSLLQPVAATDRPATHSAIMVAAKFVSCETWYIAVTVRDILITITKTITKTRNTFCGTWYLPHSHVHNERTVFL